jgi:hypothetical protein
MICWTGYERMQLWPYLRNYPSIFMEELRKNTKTSVRIAGPGLKFEIGTSRI